MDTGTFYGPRRSRYGRLTRYILTRNVPDDVNISTVGDSSSDEGDQIATQTDTDSDSQEQSDESADEDQESVSSVESDDESASSVDANVTSTWSSVYKATGCLPRQFAADHGTLILLPDEAKPVDYFSLLFPDSVYFNKQRNQQICRSEKPMRSYISTGLR